MKKIFLILSLITLVSCEQRIPSDSITSSDSSTSPSETKTLRYSHQFKQTDFAKAGGETKNINGIVWNYTPFAYLGGSGQGVQLGSAASPQIEKWTLSTSFPEEVIIKSYSVELSNANSGGGEYTFEFDTYTKSSRFACPNMVTEFKEEDLNVPTNLFSFSLVAYIAKAIYFNSLSFVVEVPSSSTLVFTEDFVEAVPVEPGKNDIPTTNYTLTTKEVYYQDVDLKLQGNELTLALRSLISTMTAVNYGNAKTMLQYTDENPNNRGFMYGLYDGDDIYATWDSGASWNREHVWACSQMKLDGTDPRPTESQKNHATDLHNLRVACGAANGFHSNKFYDTTNTSTTLYPNIVENLAGKHSYRGDFRGDVARILFYMYVRYEGLKLNDELNINDGLSMGKLSVLLTWNQEDPVDEFETQRNNRIFEYQGNRNPFIDYPVLADQLF